VREAEQVVVGLPPRYRDAVLVARGGMGEVYRARDDVLDRVVAVKVLTDGNLPMWERRLRFQREAAAAARLSKEPHVVAVYDFGDLAGAEYIVMEWCPNGDVLQYACRHEVDVPRVQKWVRQAAAALDAAHAAGVVHRDVKPANLLLDADCDVKVADFGIAHLSGEETGITAAGTMLGTAGYMSPEQARGEPATPASDRYSLAVIAFELLAGRRPHQSDDALAEAAAHATAAPPRISRLTALPAEVDHVFERGLAKRPAERYPTAAAFSSALDAALEPTRQTPTRVVTPTGRPSSMHRYASDRQTRRLAAVSLFAVGMVLALLVGVWAAVTLIDHSQHTSTPRVITRVVTAQGTTSTRVVTTRPAATATTLTVTTTAGSTPSARGPAPPPLDAHQLNDQGYALINQRDYAQAVPLLRRAVAGLRGTGATDPYEAYANYNLGYALLQLGHCRAAIRPLTTANHLESAHAVDVALGRAYRCA
jgi:serine/threonine protein kinase